MKNTLNSIFDDQYSNKATAFRRQPPLAYRLLNRFETYRTDKISQLIKTNKLCALDIGCGSGEFLFNIQNKLKFAVGIDVVKDVLESAKKRKFSIKNQFIQADLGRSPIPFPDNSFDLVTSIATLQLVYDLELLFGEVYRVLKPGGLFIFEVPNILVFWRRLNLILGKFPRTSLYENGWAGGEIHYFTIENLTNFCLKHHFEIRKITCSGIFDKIRSTYPSLLGGDLIFICQKRGK
jgi:ubiquinone/menaquinone biosynthesis C-methylase UbiE